ncbi:hypothetical protein FRC05_010343 [Tulasnella sp. 425]|nr:hypothetical protein FRC05_010343 [Tulasnella sp. 425]
MSGLFLALRSVEFGSLERPVRRVPLARSYLPTNPPHPRIQELLNSIDLSINLRGIGCDFGEGTGLKLPPSSPYSRRVHTDQQFLAAKLLFSIPTNYIISDFISTYCIRDPSIRALAAGNLCLGDLPIAKRVSVLGAFVFGVPAILSLVYDLIAVLAVTFVPGQDHYQWPPLFGAPWLSDSLHEFWAIRWHQVLRQTFLLTGGYPLGYLFGRSGFVIGAFASSGFFHSVMLIGDGATTFPWSTFNFFAIQALGIALEEWFRTLTGRRVGGLIGRVWVFGWFWLVGRQVCELWIQAGIYDIRLIPVAMSVAELVWG